MLVIENATLEEGGYYHCYGMSVKGYNFWSRGFLKIYGRLVTECLFISNYTKKSDNREQSIEKATNDNINNCKTKILIVVSVFNQNGTIIFVRYHEIPRHLTYPHINFTFVVHSRITPNMIVIKTNEIGSFYCLSNPNVQWSFNGGKLLHNVTIENRNEISIYYPSNKYQGYYECRGTDELNRVFFARGLLLIRSK